MSFESYKVTIQKRLGKGEINSAIDLLLEFFQKSQNKKNYNQILLIKTKWVATEEEYKIIGTISKNDYDISFSRTIQAIQEVMDTVPEFEVVERLNHRVELDNNIKSRFIQKTLSISLIFLFTIGSFLYWFENKKHKNIANDNHSDLQVIYLDSTKTQGKSLFYSKDENSKEGKSAKSNISLHTQAIKETMSSNIETHVIGLNFFDENNENDSDLSDKIVKALTSENHPLVTADQYQIKNYSRGIIAHLTINKLKERKIFNDKVISYDVKLSLKYSNTITGQLCSESKFHTIVDANESDSNIKIRIQGLTEILRKVNLNNPFFSCT